MRRCGPLAVPGALLMACVAPAAEHARGSGYAFPDAFEATQVVTAVAGGEAREFLASVRRRGDDYDVTLFDPVFATPLLSASLRGGVAGEQRIAAATVPVGEGTRLVELVRGVYVAHYSTLERDRTTLDTAGFTAVLIGFRDYPDCLFPASIEIRPKMGPLSRVEVRTVDLRCEASRAVPR